MKMSKSLFQCEEAKVLWEMSDDAVLELVKLGDLYPGIYMPDDIRNIEVEVLNLHKFKNKDREKALAWLEKNIDFVD
jgi:hypothetical protein